MEIINEQKMNFMRQNQTHPVQVLVQAIAVQGAIPKTLIPHCRCRVQATTCNKKVQESAKMKCNNNKWEIKPLPAQKQTYPVQAPLSPRPQLIVVLLKMILACS